jgi:hypothetical protein
MLVCKIAGQGNDSKIPNNFIADHAFNFQCCTFWIKHLEMYQDADTRATTNT